MKAKASTLIPRIAANLAVINGLISPQDIAEMQADLPGACDQMYKHARRRIKESSASPVSIAFHLGRSCRF